MAKTDFDDSLDRFNQEADEETEERDVDVRELGRPLPGWYKAVMFGLLIVGLLWICVFYLSMQLYPIPGIGGWNILIGFGLAMIGFLMMSRWGE